LSAAERRRTARAISQLGVVAIVRAGSADEAIEHGEMLVAAGLRAIEVALTTPRGLEAITTLAGVEDGRIVGAGTVLDAEAARAAAAAGARFVVSPGLDEETVVEAARLGVVSMPGAATATEIMRARGLGADFIKLFPASTYGVEHLRAVRVVFPDVAFVPTGGVGPENAAAWFEAGAAAIAVGSALTRGGPSAAELLARELLSAAGAGTPARG
jgi:2-dehydro-3-deoxyphosphogluconate aldolase/(4S)-4-hydroxy-2-oxoglutarate aldolase